MTRRFGEKDSASISRSLEMQIGAAQVSEERPNSRPEKAVSKGDHQGLYKHGDSEPEYQELREKNRRLERRLVDIKKDRD